MLTLVFSCGLRVIIPSHECQLEPIDDGNDTIILPFEYNVHSVQFLRNGHLGVSVIDVLILFRLLNYAQFVDDIPIVANHLMTLSLQPSLFYGINLHDFEDLVLHVHLPHIWDSVAIQQKFEVPYLRMLISLDRTNDAYDFVSQVKTFDDEFLQLILILEPADWYINHKYPSWFWLELIRRHGVPPTPDMVSMMNDEDILKIPHCRVASFFTDWNRPRSTKAIIHLLRIFTYTQFYNILPYVSEETAFEIIEDGFPEEFYRSSMRSCKPPILDAILRHADWDITYNIIDRIYAIKDVEWLLRNKKVSFSSPTLLSRVLSVYDAIDLFDNHAVWYMMSDSDCVERSRHFYRRVFHRSDEFKVLILRNICRYRMIEFIDLLLDNLSIVYQYKILLNVVGIPSWDFAVLSCRDPVLLKYVFRQCSRISILRPYFKYMTYDGIEDKFLVCLGDSNEKGLLDIFFNTTPVNPRIAHKVLNLIGEPNNKETIELYRKWLDFVQNNQNV